MTISILLVDDNIVFRNGVRMFLEQFNDFRIVGEASNGIEALSLAEQYLPDLMVLDWVMPGMNGLDVLRQINKAGYKTSVIVLSMYSYEGYVTEALNNGAYGFVIKDDVVAHLANAIRSAAARKPYISSIMDK